MSDTIFYDVGKLEAALLQREEARCAGLLLQQALLECRDFIADLKGGAKFEGRALDHADELIANADALLTDDVGQK